MSERVTHGLRLYAAILTTLSGAAQVATLWLRNLDAAAVLAALLGATYLIIGIGLFGRSRFSLFVAIAVPGTAAAALLHCIGTPAPANLLRIAVDGLIVLLSATVLWRVRHTPTP
ncbi:MAG: hypothetical protein KDI09_11740 [Halioglobus sp.]|nr:hypothetical protein [Halioglobus sp.]